MYTHVRKCKNDTCWNSTRNQGKEDERAVEGMNSSMIYLIHVRTFVNATMCPQPAQQEKIWKCNTFVHESNVRNLSVWLSLTQLAKTLCLPYYAYVFSSTKLEIRAEQDLPGSKGGRGDKGAGGRSDPSNVLTG
jgi:hypothetical protein